MRKHTPIARFWRSYLVSEVVLLLSLYSGIVRSPWLYSRVSWALAGILVLGIVTLVPLVPTGRSRVQRRIGTIISGILSGMIAVLSVLVFEELKITGGEGPNGEGSPLAAILGMVFFTAFFTIPWAITLVRGMRSRNAPEAE